MKKVNNDDLRKVYGGGKMTCIKCGYSSTSQTLIYWHVHAGHGISLGKVWSYIRGW